MYSGLEDESIDLLEIMELGNPGLVPSIRQIRKAIDVVESFCKANGKERLGIGVTSMPNKIMGGRYEPGPNILTMFIPEQLNEKWTDDYRMKPDDDSPYTLVLHEYGHWIHWKWAKHAEIPMGENRLSAHDEPDDPDERFAETMRVFMDNPNTLKIQNPSRYEWCIANIKLPEREWPEGDSVLYEHEAEVDKENFVETFAGIMKDNEGDFGKSVDVIRKRMGFIDWAAEADAEKKRNDKNAR